MPGGDLSSETGELDADLSIETHLSPLHRSNSHCSNCSTVCFAAGGALKSGFGFLAFSGIARLTWLVELFGELSVSTATIEDDPESNYCKMTATLLTAAGR